MSSKIILLLGLAAIANAGVFAPTAYYAAPTIINAEQPANYQFQYNINDGLTGDFKSQSERADNGAVSGSYQLIDADGYLRVVDYTADDINGFQANVRREPLAKQLIAQPILAKYVTAPY